MMKKFRTPADRTAFCEVLAPRIRDRLRVDEDTLNEAIFEGRQGLNEMSDSVLIDYANECYGLEPDPGALDHRRFPR